MINEKKYILKNETLSLVLYDISQISVWVSDLKCRFCMVFIDHLYKS